MAVFIINTVNGDFRDYLKVLKSIVGDFFNFRSDSIKIDLVVMSPKVTMIR